MRNLTEDGSQCLAWKWNWFRQSLVEGSSDFAQLATRCGSERDSAVWNGLEERCQQLAHGLAEVLRSAEFPQVRIHKPLQWFFRRHLDAARSEDVIDGASVLRVMLWRLFRQMEDSLKEDPKSKDLVEELSPVVRGLRAVVEQLTVWLEQQPDSAVKDCLDQSREVDRLVVHELRPFEEVLWQLPGLGRSRDVSAAV